MSFRSLGEFIEAAARTGDVRVIHGADRDRDVGCLTELSAECNGPLLLFDQFEGFDPTFRVASNVLNSRRRRLLDDRPTDGRSDGETRGQGQRPRELRLIPPVEVKDGPVLTHTMVGDDVDIQRFPAPKWHPLDGGHYIGTGDIVVVQDPDTGQTNYGTYRACVQGRDRVSLWIIRHKAGRIIAEKYWAQGQPCPIAVVLGCDPLTYSTGTSGYTGKKYDYAGALHGAPVEVLRGPETGLLIPAEAEIVLEGEMPSPEEESVFEGPFGEWPGYYSHTGHECVVRVHRVHYRPSPIIYGSPPLRPLLNWEEDGRVGGRLMDHLEQCGITDVVAAAGHVSGLMVVISLRQRYPGHAKQALVAAAGLRTGASMYSMYIAVDEDVDPASMRDVLWALCTRVDPARQVDIVPAMWTSDLDPRLSPGQKADGEYRVGRMLIDACRPFEWRDQFPPANVFSPEQRAEVRSRWEDLMGELEQWASQRTAMGHRA